MTSPQVKKDEPLVLKLFGNISSMPLNLFSIYPYFDIVFKSNTESVSTENIASITKCFKKQNSYFP